MKFVINIRVYALTQVDKYDGTSSTNTDLNIKIKRVFMLPERIEGKWIAVF